MSRAVRLGDVLGQGSAREGVRHWWQLRTTSAALALLGAWFVAAIAMLPDLGHAAVAAWVARPVNAVLLLSFIGVSAWHSALGLQVVIEDYVRSKGARALLLVALRCVHALAGVAAALAVLQLALGGRS